MALRALSICNKLIKPFQKLAIANSNEVVNKHLLKNGFLSVSQPQYGILRESSFFCKLPAEFLWKSVTSVSPAGAKKGRGKGAGRKRSKDLNKGQFIGQGRINMVWPGLNAPVIQGKQLISRQELPEDPERMAKIYKIRDSMTTFRFLKLHSLERGWSGVKMHGRSIGPPDPIGEDNFEGFNTIVVEFISLMLMRGGLGRTRKISTTVVTGNGNGLAGFATAKSREAAAALRKAKNRAGQKLLHIDLCDNHTVFHDFCGVFHKTRIFVHKKPMGYGLVGHRVVKAICQMIGIKDIHAKVEGSTNVKSIVKAFFIGLMQQKSHQTMADEKQLHLVEYKKECQLFPKVVASPSIVRTKEEISPNEVLDFTRYALDNRVMYVKKKIPPFYTRMRHWNIYLKVQEKYRSRETIKMDMYTEHGELKSFLNDRYIESEEVKEN